MLHADMKRERQRTASNVGAREVALVTMLLLDASRMYESSSGSRVQARMHASIDTALCSMLTQCSDVLPETALQRCVGCN